MHRLRRALTCGLAVCAAVLLQPVAHGADQTAPELASSPQRKYDGIKDFSGR